MRRTRFVFACLIALTLAAVPVVAASAPLPAAPKAAEKTPALPPLPPIPAPAAPAEEPATVTAPAAAPAVAPAPDTVTTPATPPVTPAAPAAEPPIVPAAKPVCPYTGYISGDLVNVRSGPGPYYYPLLTMNKDTPVVVEAESDGWLALRPPEGVFGLVAKKDLTMGTDGKTGTVSAPAARVYSASATATRRWCVMSTLKQGDTVAVTGPGDAEFVQIAPPADARIYVVDKYVAAKSSGTGVDPAIAKINIEPPKVDPLVEDYKAAEALLKAELAKPLAERKYDESAAKFKEVAEKADKPYLKEAAEKRVAYIAALAEQQVDFLKVTGLSKELDQKLADLKTQWAGKQVDAERDKKLASPDFLATGLVAKMESLDEVDYPIKFKLVDQENRPLVVLQSTAYDLNKYVGKVIGVRGTKKYLKEWRIYAVTVDDLEVIEE